MSKLLQAFVLAALAVPLCAAGNWPQLHGPDANGHAGDSRLPLTWSETQHVAWKTPIPGRGWSSPVIWADQIWLTTATPDGHALSALCLDRATGRVLRDVKLFEVEKPQRVNGINSYASPTPVIEAGRVYVHFGTYGTACLDTRTAAVLWTRRDIHCDHEQGPGSSPILFEDLLIFHMDGCDAQFVIALDKTTGRTVWKTPRSADYAKSRYDQHKAFYTPIVIAAAGRQELISPGAQGIFAYDPRSGAELWKALHRGWSGVPRPLFGLGMLFVSTDCERAELWAVRPGGQGDVTASRVAWKATRGITARPTPLLIDETLYFVTEGGVARALDARSGEPIWQHTLGGQFSASPLVAGGRIYFFSERGPATVIAPGRTYKELAVNQLDAGCMASPAVVGDALYLRTKTHLYRIEDDKVTR